MLLPRRVLVPLVLATTVLLGGCGPGGGNSTDGPINPILADDLDLDSYHAEGSIDGLTWTAELCALNLIPAWAVYFEGQDIPAYRMQFEAYDSEISGGVVTGQWQLEDGNPDHPVQINKGTFTVATDAGAQEAGTISVELQVTDYPPGGDAFTREVSGVLNLTPVVDSPGCTVTDTPEYLTEALKTYAGPSGG